MTSQPPEPRPEQSGQPELGPEGTTAVPVTAEGGDQPATPARRAGRVVGIALGGMAATLVAAYAVGLGLAGDKIPKNATVEGVAIGGLSPVVATQTLTAALEADSTAPLRLEIAGEQAELDPVDAGLSIDYPASVEAAGGGRSLDPRHVYRVLTGGSETAAVVRVDGAKLSAAVGSLAADQDRSPRNAAVSYDGRRVVTKEGVPGVTIDQDSAAEVVRDAYPDDGSVRIPAATTDPEITTEAMLVVARDVARPAVAAPVVVKTGPAGTFEVSPSMIAEALTFSAVDGALAPTLDEPGLRKAVDDRISDLELTQHRDATVRLMKGRPAVIPAAAGTDITADDLAAAVRPALTRPKGERTVRVKLTGAKPDFSTRDAERLGITEVTGKFTTYFPYAYYRNVNIGRAAEKINNSVLKPGETFSLNKIVGERTKAGGFVEGYIISGGKFKKELGGGVSQSATTTFNAMFFAGLADVQHQPHTLYIDRYPAGREATVAWPSLDLKFKNATKYGVLVQAYVKKGTPSRQGSITVKMWSTRSWDKVSSTALVRSNYTTGRDLTDDSPRCEPQAPVQGFTVNYSRLFYRDGKVVKREPFRWRYAPTDRIRCT